MRRNARLTTLIIEAACTSAGTDAPAILGNDRTRTTTDIRRAIIYGLYSLGWTPVDIAEHLQRHRSTIIRALEVSEGIMATDTDYRRQLIRIVTAMADAYVSSVQP